MSLDTQARQFETEARATASALGHNLKRFSDFPLQNNVFRQAFCENCGAMVIYLPVNPAAINGEPLNQRCAYAPRTTKGGHAV